MGNSKKISRGKFIYYSAVGTIVATIPGKLLAQVCEITTDDIPGPFYEPNSPIRTLIAHPDEPGTRLVINGQVKGTDCEPIQNATVEVWQADDDGCYSVFNVCENGTIEDEYKLRGTIITDENGQYGYETILPANYANRPRHIHYKITAPDGTFLITQLYFEDDPLCETDPWCVNATDRTIPLTDESSILYGEFDITLNTVMISAQMGDVNQDGSVDVLDIVSTVSYILGNSHFDETQLYLADFNQDGIINVLDIVQMVIILMESSSSQFNRKNCYPITNPQINIENGQVNLSCGGHVAGIELDVTGEFKLTHIPHNWNIHYNENKILLFSEDGLPLNSEVLFEYEGELMINSNILSDWESHRSIAEVNIVDKEFSLDNAYPNPFNPQTKLEYSLNASSNVEIYITDVMGRKIETIFSGQKSMGTHHCVWNASGFASGMYFAHLRVEQQIVSKKLIFVK